MYRTFDLDPADVFQTLLLESRSAVILVRPDGQVESVNAAAKSALEPLVGPLAGRSWSEVWPPEARDAIRQALQRAAAGERPCLTRPLEARGLVRHFEQHFEPLRNRAGEVAAVIVFTIDLTEQVVARLEAEARERALEEKAAALRAAGLLAQLGGYQLDLRTGELECSDELWDLLGAAPRELNLREIMDLFVEEEVRTRVAGLILNAAQTCQGFSYVARMRRFDGRVIWASVVAEPRVEKGVCVGLRGVAQDITSAHETLAKLAEAERRLRLATNMADLHVWELDFASGAFHQEGAESAILDWFDREELRRDPFCVVSAEDRPRVVAAWKEAVAARRTLSIEFRVNRRDAVERWCHALSWLEHDSAGQPLRWIGALRDITERKRNEQELVLARDAAQAASQAKSEFLANMSHEIRTPLNAVLGMAQVMTRDALDPVQRERLEVIRSAGQGLLALLNDLLDLSKIEAAKLELADTEFSLEKVMRAACDPLVALASARDLPLRVTIDETAQGVWRGDPERVRQIVTNLVGNAVKFTCTGSVEVEVAAPNGIVIRVSDTGVGIDPNTLPFLFESFAQADSSVTRKFGGTGLGLAISRRLARLMGGDILVESVKGQGTTFTVQLPLERLGPSRGTSGAEAEPPAKAAPAPPARTLKVLAAEDNVTNQLVLRAMLEPLQAEVETVSDGEQAVEVWKRGGHDIILMDIQMPVMDGVSATRAIREIERDKGAARTPIIALTANAMRHQVEAYLAAGLDAHVAKPIETEVLYETIERLLTPGLAKAPRRAGPAA